METDEEEKREKTTKGEENNCWEIPKVGRDVTRGRGLTCGASTKNGPLKPAR